MCYSVFLHNGVGGLLLLEHMSFNLIYHRRNFGKLAQVNQPVGVKIGNADSAQLPRVDDILKKYVAAGRDGNYRRKICIGNQDGKQGVFLPKALPAGDVVVKIAPGYFACAELPQARRKAGACKQPQYMRIEMAVGNGAQCQPDGDNERNASQVKGKVAEKQRPFFAKGNQFCHHNPSGLCAILLQVLSCIFKTIIKPP